MCSVVRFRFPATNPRVRSKRSFTFLVFVQPRFPYIIRLPWGEQGPDAEAAVAEVAETKTFVGFLHTLTP